MAPTPRFRSRLLLVSSIAFVASCSSSDEQGAPDASETTDGAIDAAVDATPNGDAPRDASVDGSVGLRIDLSFERLDATGAFRVIAQVMRGSTPEKGAHVSFDGPRGTISGAVDEGDGRTSTKVTPDVAHTGEYPLHAAVTGSSPIIEATRTALVLGAIDDRWGQPESVRGLVNTPAWEDSVGVSADGEWLFLEYLPVAIDCALFHLAEPTHPTCAKVRGPIGAPARPGMPGAERVASDGTIHQGCPSIGFDPAPFAVPPQSLFGFHRQPDGSYAEPFALSVEGADGCISAFGPSPFTSSDGRPRLLFAFDDPTDNDPSKDSGSDLFVHDLMLGSPQSLAHVASGAFIVDGTLLGFPKAGSTGNPSQALVGGAVRAVFFDDESKAEGDRDLYVRLSIGDFPNGPYGAAQKLPDSISQVGTAEIQPAFDGNELFFRRGDDVGSSHYGSGAFGDASAWSSVRADLKAGTDTAVGSIRTLGEPNAATRGGKRVLFFVYAIRAEDGTLDLNVGTVEAR